ncbi:ATP-binding cassette domain-containing protein [Actinophytocola sp.]|uniref:ATP-binding cassette domain-containing protein n=1 Tax=Actinophytocola sp. TaxID=1872138 RepID=UPI0039C870BE
MALLELRGVSKAFGAVQALRDVSLALHAGEIHALAGENGAGKSTVVRIMAMDEPTAALSGVEAERLFGVARLLAAGGAALLLISHRLGEMYALCERVTVLRDGSVVTSGRMSAVDHDTLVRSMVGRSAELGYLAAYAAAALASGQITGAEGETLKAGKLGERKIGKDGGGILGPPTTFNTSNIDKYDF